MASALLAACSPTTAVAPTSPPTTGAAPTAPTAAPVATTAPAATSAAAKPVASTAPTSASTSAGGQVSSKPKAVIGFTQEPTSLDPTADATASIATILLDNLYQGLVRLDASGKVIGSLASTWDVSQDGTQVTFHLNKGVRWHDGSPF